jgi:cyanophycinase
MTGWIKNVRIVSVRALVGAGALACVLTTSPVHAGGSLLIVGGALRDDNAEVHRALIDAMPEQGPMVIIPAASGRPARSAAGFTDALVAHGLARERIMTFPLAVRDDSATPDVDESAWSRNAWDEKLVADVKNAAGFWFTGGDQVRITRSMLGEDEQPSPLLRQIRARLSAGAVIGGSSAGAAIMSQEMIAGGVSFTALLNPPTTDYADTEAQDSGRLYLDRGLGFLPEGLVDQHFDRKARLGRLVRAMAATGQRRGYGIDEDTALQLRLGQDQARVLGRGTVTVLDAANARFGFATPMLASDLELSVFAPGVTFRRSDVVPLSGHGDATLGSEYFGYRPTQGGGMAFANTRLDQALGYDLLDNDSVNTLDRYSIDEEGNILVYRFRQAGDSAGFWRSEGSDDRYTASRVRFDILKRKVELPDH